MSLKKFFVFFLCCYHFFYGKAQVLEGCKNPCEKVHIVAHGPLLGVRAKDIPDSSEVRIEAIIKGGAAERNGIVLDDVIISIDNITLYNTAHLMDEIAIRKPGDSITLKILRETDTLVKKLPLGAEYTEKVIVMECCDEPEKIPEQDGYIITPKQARDKLSIISLDLIDGDVEIKIYDLKGNLLKTELVHLQNEKLVVTIPISDLKAGNYFLRINTKGNPFIHKLEIVE